MLDLTQTLNMCSQLHTTCTSIKLLKINAFQLKETAKSKSMCLLLTLKQFNVCSQYFPILFLKLSFTNSWLNDFLPHGFLCFCCCCFLHLNKCSKTLVATHQFSQPLHILQDIEQCYFWMKTSFRHIHALKCQLKVNLNLLWLPQSMNNNS